MDLLALLLALCVGVALGLTVASSRTTALRMSLHAAELALERTRGDDADLALRQQGVDAVVEPLREQLASSTASCACSRPSGRASSASCPRRWAR